MKKYAVLPNFGHTYTKNNKNIYNYLFIFDFVCGIIYKILILMGILLYFS